MKKLLFHMAMKFFSKTKLSIIFLSENSSLLFQVHHQLKSFEHKKNCFDFKCEKTELLIFNNFSKIKLSFGPTLKINSKFLLSHQNKATISF